MPLLQRFSFILTFLISLLLSVNTIAAAKLDAHLLRLIDTNQTQHTIKELAKTFKDKQNRIRIHLFIEGDSSTLPALTALGVTINTVTSSGIMTATAPLNKIRAISEIAGIRSLEASRTVKAFMNLSTGEEGVNLPDTALDRSTNAGNGVIIGIIDSGIDIEHGDFFDMTGNTRILSIWDHTLDADDVSNMAFSPSEFSYGTQWSQTQIQGGYASCMHRDSNGHGTHVAGTAAGSGLAAGDEAEADFAGIAPKAELLIVKFDFENEKSRNTETAILDGINWIFQRAEAKGKLAVINMSLGSDYGPHDGTTSEERGINDLTGAGKIIVVAAGNAGAVYGGTGFDTFGAPIHGAGNFSTDYDIVLQTNTDYAPDANQADYLFWDAWYDGSAQMRVQITAPNGEKYPSSFVARNLNVWKTDGTSGAYNTPQGYIYVFNGSNTDNNDNNLYIEISDAGGFEPAAGQWVIELIPESGTDDYNAWHGFSSSLKKTYFWYDSNSTSHVLGDNNNIYLSDSVMTIGKPATAANVISVGAYQTKNEWQAREYVDPYNPESDFDLITQAYGIAPIDYYTPFVLHDLASFSSRGPARDGRTQPFISAPGVGIVASLSQTVLNDPADTYFRHLNRVEYGGKHAALQGTSMSSPHVTGVIALLLEKAQSIALTPTPDDIKNYIAKGAYSDSFTTDIIPNNEWGYGKIDTIASLAEIQATSVEILEITTSSLNNGQVDVAYSDSLAASGGIPPYTWSVNGLPDGLSLEDSSTGSITGIPTSEGSFIVNISVTDDVGDQYTATLNIQIDSATTVSPLITSVTPDEATPGTRLTITMTGENFESGALVTMGSDITVQKVTWVNAAELSVRISVGRKASSGSVDIIVANPGGESSTLVGGFTIL